MGCSRSCKRDVIAVVDALDRGDFETVKRQGHDMQGAGGDQGFQAITPDMGTAIEEAARSANADASRMCVGELSMYLDRV